MKAMRPYSYKPDFNRNFLTTRYILSTMWEGSIKRNKVIHFLSLSCLGQKFKPLSSLFSKPWISAVESTIPSIIQTFFTTFCSDHHHLSMDHTRSLVIVLLSSTPPNSTLSIFHIAARMNVLKIKSGHSINTPDKLQTPYHSLQDLYLSLLPHFPCFPPCWPQPHGAAHCSLNTPSLCLAQVLCTSGFFCTESSSRCPNSCPKMFTWFGSLLKFHSLWKVYS